MCRSNSDGGRRCPCSSPERRSSYRKAKTALSITERSGTALNGIGDAGVIVDVSPSDVKTDLCTTWQPDRMRQMLEDYSDFMNPRNDSSNLQEVVNSWGQEPGHHNVIRMFGAAVAAEAERRAGVTLEEISKRAEDRKVQLKGDISTIKVEVEQLKEKKANTPEHKAYMAYHSVVMNKERDPGEDPAIYAAEFEELNRLKKLDDESDVAIKYNEAVAKQRELSEVYGSGITDTDKQDLAKLSDAYLSTLGEVRSMGGKFAFAKGTRNDVAKAFQSCTEVFPTDWIEYSNMSSQYLKAKLVTGKTRNDRAYYTHRKIAKHKVKSRDKSPYPLYGRDIPKDTVDKSYRKMTEEEVADFVSKYPNSNVTDMVMVEKWETYSIYNSDVDENTKPDKRGDWEIAHDHEGFKVWRRPLESITKKESIHSEVWTDADPSIVRRDESFNALYASTSAHELMHRMEYVVPGLMAAERGFYKDRTTSAETGELEEKIALYDGRKWRGDQEFTRPDKFVDIYMGKDYDGGAYELMSMGTESLFYGESGGLVGVNNYSADADMRSFVLGALATVGRNTTKSE